MLSRFLIDTGAILQKAIPVMDRYPKNLISKILRIDKVKNQLNCKQIPKNFYEISLIKSKKILIVCDYHLGMTRLFLKTLINKGSVSKASSLFQRKFKVLTHDLPLIVQVVVRLRA